MVPATCTNCATKKITARFLLLQFCCVLFREECFCIQRFSKTRWGNFAASLKSLIWPFSWRTCTKQGCHENMQEATLVRNDEGKDYPTPAALLHISLVIRHRSVYVRSRVVLLARFHPCFVPVYLKYSPFTGPSLLKTKSCKSFSCVVWVREGLQTDPQMHKTSSRWHDVYSDRIRAYWLVFKIFTFSFSPIRMHMFKW